MIFYINFLRVLACALITNAHLENVWPNSIIANGGLLGDVIFFAVSAFCLINIRDSFFRWYGKRLKRIYSIVWIATIFYIIVGEYEITGILSFFKIMFWPTNYHFVGSIILLYIPYYFFIKKTNVNKDLKLISGILFILQFIIYIFIYDKSYYHIDIVKEPMIWFLYMQAMIIGINFRINGEKYKTDFKKNTYIVNIMLAGILFVIYFLTKLVLIKGLYSHLQIINQLVLLALLFFIFKIFTIASNKLDYIPDRLKKFINYVSTITLEIYVVQKPIIKLFENIVFPINLLVVLIVIFMAAVALNFSVKLFFKLIDKKECEK